MKNINNCKP